ncbi:MAG: hypothetical protein ACSLE2_03375 [Lysobacterales bacterium]
MEIKLIEVLAADDAASFRLFEKLQSEELESFWEKAHDHVVPDTDPPELTAQFLQLVEDLQNEIKKTAFRLKRNAEMRYKLQEEDLSLKEMRRAYKEYLYEREQSKVNIAPPRQANEP